MLSSIMNPYFFRESTFSEEFAQELLDFTVQNSSELGVQIICNYIKTQNLKLLIANEKTAIDNLFPENSLIRSYFTWLFN